jgi:hypothetical protein
MGFMRDVTVGSRWRVREFVDTREREWDSCEMIVEHYNKSPDPKLRIYNEGECDDELVYND